MKDTVLKSPSTDKALLLCAILALSGCASEVPEWQILSMQKACADHGGLAVINTAVVTGGRCRDGLIVGPERGK